MSLDQKISHIKWDATSRSSKEKSKLRSSNKKQKPRSRYTYINVQLYLLIIIVSRKQLTTSLEDYIDASSSECEEAAIASKNLTKKR